LRVLYGPFFPFKRTWSFAVRAGAWAAGTSSKSSLPSETPPPFEPTWAPSGRITARTLLPVVGNRE